MKQAILKSVKCKAVYLKAKTKYGKDGILWAANTDEAADKMMSLLGNAKKIVVRSGHDIAMRHLRNSTDDFSVEDGLRILQDVKQTGNWATRVSFVYSRNNNTVYYCLNGQFNQIEQHMLYS